MGACCCTQEEIDSEASFRLCMETGRSDTEAERLHGIVRQHAHSQTRPTRNLARDARRLHMMNMLCTDSVQWQLAEKEKTYARPCPADIHAARGSVTVDVVATFPGEDFQQDELDDVAADPLFASKLLYQTGLDTYEWHTIGLLCVLSNADSLMFSVQANCSCAQK